MVLPQEPNWMIVTVIGAIAGASVNWWWPLIRYWTGRRRRSFLLGDWHGYHATFYAGQPVIVHDTFRVRRGVRGALIVSAEQNDGLAPSLTYSGEVRLEGHIVFVLSAKSHEETLVLRFVEPIPSNPTPMVGLWLSQDHDRNPACGTIALTRAELSSTEAAKLLESRSTTAAGAIRIDPPHIRNAQLREIYAPTGDSDSG